MPSIALAPTSRPSASSSLCIYAAQRSTSSTSSAMTSETPEPGLCPACGATGLLCRTPGHSLPGTIIGGRSRPPEKVPRSKIGHLNPPRPFTNVDSATKSLIPKVGESIEGDTTEKRVSCCHNRHSKDELGCTESADGPPAGPTGPR